MQVGRSHLNDMFIPVVADSEPLSFSIHNLSPLDFHSSSKNYFLIS